MVGFLGDALAVQRAGCTGISAVRDCVAAQALLKSSLRDRGQHSKLPVG